MDKPVGGNPGGSQGRGRGRRVNPFTQTAIGQDQANVQGSGRGKPAAQQPLAPTVIGTGAVKRQEATTSVAAPAKSVGTVSMGDVNRAAVRRNRVLAELVHSRPKTCITKAGITGQRIVVQANHFRVLRKPEWTIHQYRVDFAPDFDSMVLRRAFLKHHAAILGVYIFDGTMLFCTTYFGDKLVNKVMELLTKNREGQTIQIKIKHVGSIDATDVQQLQVQNLILRRAMMHLQLEQVGRNLFDPKSKIRMDNYHMEIWPGYQTSIRQHERDLLLCCDIAHKVMRTDTVYNILADHVSAGGANYQDNFKKEMVGTIVLTDYNNKTYRVDDVDFTETPLKTFQKNDKTVMSLAQYYKDRYNITIRDMRQPLLVSQPTAKAIRGGQTQGILLIPELTRATGITDAMRSNMRLMKAMSEHTRLLPDRRIQRLMQFNNRLQNSKESMAVLNDWNLKLDRNLVELQARVLGPETILFGNSKRYQCDSTADWSRHFRNTTMNAHRDIKRWAVIVPRRNTREVQEFVQMCINGARGMGMNIARPGYEEMPDDRNGSYLQAIEAAAQKDPQIVMIVMVNNNEEKYACIKKKCCVDRALPSQVVTLRVVSPRGDRARGLMSVAVKVVIQMNAKLRGAPWLISLPLPKLMTVGFDVCHSAKDRNKSFGALVATMDMNRSTRYYSSVTPHEKGQELSCEIAMKMSLAVTAYHNEHSELPGRIVFYRDGVGEGQLNQVYNTEVVVLKKKLDEMYRKAGIAEGCRLCFVVVSKGINTRFFVNKGNPVPGTVVDDIVTLPERYDFFLVSQSVRQGTVSPTSYNVLFDNMGLSADKLQQLTYKMTHMYYNWSGTTRVPAVCLYAHKLAFLVAESLHRAPNNGLENQLYFL